MTENFSSFADFEKNRKECRSRRADGAGGVGVGRH